MSERVENLRQKVEEKLAEFGAKTFMHVGQLTVEFAVDKFYDAMLVLRDDEDFAFEELIDVCGVDYVAYGDEEWSTEESTSTGFSRGVHANTAGRLDLDGMFGFSAEKTKGDEPRFASVYQLLSISKNHRVTVRVFAENNELPVLPSVVSIWSGANWFEREAFDLFGIVYEGHPDLRRILTDYGFQGHPFRKDFPLSGNVEVIYDEEKKRVVYQPVSIEPRVLVPRVIRDDSRYGADVVDQGDADA